MNINYSINKFSSFENYIFQEKIFDTENSILNKFSELKFFEPSKHLRELFILSEISKKADISQKYISQKVKVVPAMINKYICSMKKRNLIRMEGKNNKTAKYYLNSEGIENYKYQMYQFVKEIMIFYKHLKNEIKKKVFEIKDIEKKKIVLYGANEIAELLIQCDDKLKKNIVCIIDSDIEKKGKEISGKKIFPYEKLYKIKFDVIIITSLTHKDDIYLKIKNFEKKIFFLQACPL